jgi:hypothetical protein
VRSSYGYHEGLQKLACSAFIRKGGISLPERRIERNQIFNFAFLLFTAIDNLEDYI